MKILSNYCVVPSTPTQKTEGSFRLGVLMTNNNTLLNMLGPPNAKPSADGKVGEHWVLETEEGPVTVYQYDINPVGHFSVAAKSEPAVALFLAAIHNNNAEHWQYYSNQEYSQNINILSRHWR